MRMFFILLFAFTVWADSTATQVYPLGKSPAPMVAVTAVRNFVWKDTAISPLVSIGMGIQTVTVNSGTGAIGVFDVLTPVNISLNLYQKELIQNLMNPVDFCLWCPSIGFLVSKPSSSNDVTVGLSFVPYSIKINKFAVGIGIAWINVGNVVLRRNNVFVTLPITYSVDIGN